MRWPRHFDPVLPFLIRRLALLLLVLLGLSALTFGLSHLVPTDPARAALGFDDSARHGRAVPA